jgi:hypothetical protein
MGRVFKVARLMTPLGVARVRAKITTGADRTILNYQIACRLGLDIGRAKTASMEAAGGSELLGFLFPVAARIGRREATVEAFVPVFRSDGKRQRRAVGRNLIGSDFMQRAKAGLDYARPHRATFGGTYRWPEDWKEVPTTADQRALLRRHAPRCSR